MNGAYIAAANPAAILALLDELEAAKRDAARYRFLRDDGVPDDDGYADDALLVYRGFGESSLLPDQLDAAIDAAIATQGAKNADQT